MTIVSPQSWRFGVEQGFKWRACSLQKSSFYIHVFYPGYSENNSYSDSEDNMTFNLFTNKLHWI